MKKIFRLLVIIVLVIALGSCKNQESISNSRDANSVEHEFDSLAALLKKFDDSSQKFSVRSNQKTKVRGKRGTIIHVDPANLTAEDGQPFGEVIDVELKELANQEDFLKANVQTVSDGQFLISGGGYYINMTSEGRQLKLKEAKGLAIEFPKLIENEMSLFYGQRDSLGQMNWKEAPQKFENVARGLDDIRTFEIVDGELTFLSETGKLDSSTVSLTKEQHENYALSDEVYDVIEISQLGWINCDRFYEIPNPTNLRLSFNPKDSIVSAIAYLIFEEMNSILESPYLVLDNRIVNDGFDGVPIGAKTKLIVFSLKNGKLLSHKSDLIIGTDQELQLTMNEIPRDSLLGLFKLGK